MQRQIPARHNCERTQMVSCIRAASGEGRRCGRPASIRARARMETVGLASRGIAPSLSARSPRVGSFCMKAPPASAGAPVLGDTLQGHAISKELTQVRRQGAPRINFGCGSPAASLLYAQSTPGAVQRRVLGKNACSDCTALFSAARESGFTGFLETTRTPKPAFQQSAKATAGRPGIAGRFCPVDPFARKA